MKKNLKTFLIAILIFTLFLCLVACNSNDKEIAINEIVISGNGINGGTLTVNENNKDIQLKATVKPENATDKNLKWETSDKEVATINESGLLHIVGKGNAKIYAKTKTKSAFIELTVNEYVKIETMQFNEKSYAITVLVNQSATMDMASELQINPENATNKAVRYSIAPEDDTVIINAQGTVIVSDKVDMTKEFTVTATSVAQPELKASTKISFKKQSATGLNVRLSSHGAARISSYIYEFSLSDKQFENITFVGEPRPIGSAGIVHYSSKNPEVCDIDMLTGVIDIKTEGNADIVISIGDADESIEKIVHVKITSEVDYVLNDLNILRNEIPEIADTSNCWDMETNPQPKDGSLFYCVQEPIAGQDLGLFYENVDNTGWNAKLMPNQGNGSFIEDGGWCTTFTTWDWPYDNEQANGYLFNRILIPEGATTVRMQARTMADQFKSGQGKFRIRLVDMENMENQVFLNINGQTAKDFTPLEDRKLEDNGVFNEKTGWITIERVADYNIGEDIYFMTIPEEWKNKECLIVLEVDDIHQDNGMGGTETGKCDAFLFIRMCLVSNNNDMAEFDNRKLD